MKRIVLLGVIIATFNQAPLVFAEDAGFSRASIPETNALQPRWDLIGGLKRPDSVTIQRSSQTMTVAQVHRSVSFRRLVLGAVIGGVAGGAFGYVSSSRSCGATASQQECAGYGRLGATVGGSVGAVVGAGIAVGIP